MGITYNDKQAALFETALDAIIIIDHQGTIQEFNPAAERIFGYSRQQAIGQEMAPLIIPSGYRQDHRKGMARYHATGHGPLMDKLLEVTAVRSDGQEFPVELTIAQIGTTDPPTFMGTLRDITDRKRNHEKLIESEERFRTMSDTAPVLIWISDVTKSATWFNKPWLQFRGRTIDQEVGTGWAEGIHPEDIDHCLDAYGSAFSNRQDFQMEFRLRRFDGQYRWMLSTGTLRYAPNGDFLGFIGSCVDLTETKQLRQQTVQLVAINRAKDEFIALASHQLRTPATGVKQYVGMLLQGYFGEMSQDQLAMLKTAYDSNERQLDIINALLNVAQLDAGNVAIKRTPCSVNELLKDIAQEQEEVFKRRNQKIELHIPRTDITADIDVRLMRMVFENIVDNAGKYSPEGKAVTVVLSRTSGKVRVSVQDHGVGMGKRDQAKLFQKFSRIDNPLSTAANGTGLGLYWAKNIVDLHGGTIRVDSQARRGSTFTITLPR